MKTSYSYKDIVLQPAYSEVRSRSELDASVEFLGRRFKSAAIPANMKCTIDFKKAEELSQAGYFYILHRFYDYEVILQWIENNQHLDTISISLGVNEKDYKFVDKLIEKKLHVDFITIDVAHGHHILVKQMITYITNKYNVKVIAGNVGTYKAAKDLYDWGADCVKIGLSMGKSCTTYNCTGVGTPMFSAVSSIARKKLTKYVVYTPGKDGTSEEGELSIPVIADGQIREVGDVCKALVAGADMVMIGSEFAKCEDSPADIVGGPAFNNENKKVFFGSASSTNKGHNGFVEGQTVYMDMRNETYLQYFNRINQGIQSCMSYAGIKDINQLYSMDYSIHTNN
jgi:GMP reductase